jgi:ubiquinol-cytochrome c reductase subunit 9
MWPLETGTSGGDSVLSVLCSGYDNVMNKIWDNHNRGVRTLKDTSPFHRATADADTREQRQWKDIRHKYVEGGDDE